MIIEQVNNQLTKTKKTNDEQSLQLSVNLSRTLELIYVNCTGLNASSTYNISGESRNCRVGRDGFGVGKLYTSFVYKLRPGTYINNASIITQLLTVFDSLAKQLFAG